VKPACTSFALNPWLSWRLRKHFTAKTYKMLIINLTSWFIANLFQCRADLLSFVPPFLSCYLVFIVVYLLDKLTSFFSLFVSALFPLQLRFSTFCTLPDFLTSFCLPYSAFSFATKWVKMPSFDTFILKSNIHTYVLYYNDDRPHQNTRVIW